ncbi:hypothetical protein D3C86_2267230 [compost metagenome]
MPQDGGQASAATWQLSHLVDGMAGRIHYLGASLNVAGMKLPNSDAPNEPINARPQPLVGRADLARECT